MLTARDNQRSKFYKYFYSLKKNSAQWGVSDFKDVIKDLVKINYHGYDVTFISTSDESHLLGTSIAINKSSVHVIQDAPKLAAYKIIQLRIHDGELLAWHGPEFCKLFAELYSRTSGISIQDIISSMQRFGLKIEGYSPVKKIGIRVEKRRDKLVSRADEIENSISEARQEFEEWLEPAINELARVRQELLTM